VDKDKVLDKVLNTDKYSFISVGKPLDILKRLDPILIRTKPFIILREISKYVLTK
jgi:hypothetical protein